MARYGATLTVDTGKMPSSQSDFAWLLTEDNFPTAAINGGATSILNGGGNLRAYTDDTKANQLPIEVVTFVTGGTPSVQVWGLSPTLGVGGTVYIEADTVGISQPSVTNTYGRNAVWLDYEAVIHASETGTDGVFVDSTGNGHDTTLTTGTTLATTATDHPFGGTWPDFTTAEVCTLTGSSQMLNNSALTMSHWINPDVSSSSRGVFGNRYSSPDSHWVQQQEYNRVFIKGGSQEDKTLGSGYTQGVNHYMVLAFDALSLVSYVDGGAVGTDSSIVNTGGISTPVGRDYRIGTYYANSSSGQRLNGRVGEIRATKLKRSASHIESEYNNQNDTSTFWSTGAWEDQDAGGGITLTVDSGNYSTNGTDTSVNANFKTGSASGNYLLTGAETALKASLNITTTEGAYSLTGSLANLLIARKLLTETGSYNLTGTDVTLTVSTAGEILVIDSGVYLLSGTETILKADLNIKPLNGNYSYVGANTPIRFNSKIHIDSGTYALTGTGLNLFTHYGILTQSANYSVAGAFVALKYSGDIAQKIGVVTSSFADEVVTSSFADNDISVGYKLNTITVTFKG